MDTSTRDRLRRSLLVVTYLTATVLLVALFMRGIDYYSTPYSERPHHQDYRSLRPAGTSGLLYGWVGAGMMVLMLCYTLRKRTKLLGSALSLRTWLDFHIFLGVFGPLFVILHTSFKVQGLVALSFWSMVVVALSGFFGRYLYLQIPRNLQGSELSLDELERISAGYLKRIESDLGVVPSGFGAIEKKLDRSSTAPTSLSGALTALLKHNLLGAWQERRLLTAWMESQGITGRRLRSLVSLWNERQRMLHRIAFLAQVHRLFHYWHAIHKPFAIIMYGVMLVHIAVAIWTGYGWISQD